MKPNLSFGAKRYKYDIAEERKKKRPVSTSDPELSRIDDKSTEERIEIVLSLGTSENVSVIPISVTQAELVYNDGRVVKFFETRMWITVLEEKMGELLDFLKEYLDGKRYLLVLDNVSNWDDKKKVFLDNLSMVGDLGSKIVLLKHTTLLADIPDTILQNIFSRLPVKSLFICKSVSKTWNAMISDPYFATMHLARENVCPILRTYEPSFLPRDLHLFEVQTTSELEVPVKIHSKLSFPKHTFSQFGIVNSCNGLICVCTTPFNNPIYVCNPVTGEYIMLPEPIYDSDMREYQMFPEDGGELGFTDFVVSGFGFSYKTNQYKVMRMLEVLEANDGEPLIQVCIVGSETWKTVDEISWEKIGLNVSRRQNLLPGQAPYKSSFTVYLNGSIHWLCNRHNVQTFISSFSFDTEQLHALPPPLHFDQDHRRGKANIRMGVLGGCLYVTDLSSYERFELWVMKNYGAQESWTKEIVIDTLSINMWPRGFFRPIKYLENGELLMFHPSNALVCYSPRTKTFRYFKIHGIDSDFEMVAYIPTIMSLKDALMLKEDDYEVPILNSRFCKQRAGDWKDLESVHLVEEDKAVISTRYSQKLEANLSFSEAFTRRHWGRFIVK